MAEKLAGAEAAASDALLEMLWKLRRDDPEGFRGLVGQPVLEILFATVEQGVPFVAERTYRLRTGPGATIELSRSGGSCPGTCPMVNGMLTLGLGVHREIDIYLGINQIYAIPEMTWPDWLEQLVQFEIEASPDGVGPPISVLELDSTGAHWSRGRRGACELELN